MHHQKKSMALLEVGQVAYQKIRNGEITDPELIELTVKLVGFDYHIYQANKKVEELNSRSGNSNSIICTSCQTPNSMDAKFCGGCGAKVEIVEKVELIGEETCAKCEEAIPVDANFCPCCGTKAIV